MERDILQIGVVRRAHGVRGQIRVQLHDEGSAALDAVSRILIGDEAVARPYEITDARALGGGVYLLSLKGLADRDAADALRGQAVWARRADLPPLGEEEFYVTDLIGCAVHDQAGAQVGTVADIEHIAGRDLLVLSRPGGGEALVPLLPEFVTSVDLPARRVEIDAPEGLLDLAQAETA